MNQAFNKTANTTLSPPEVAYILNKCKYIAFTLTP